MNEYLSHGRWGWKVTTPAVGSVSLVVSAVVVSVVHNLSPCSIYCQQYLLVYLHIISTGEQWAASGRHFASASDLLALTVALERILALKR